MHQFVIEFQIMYKQKESLKTSIKILINTLRHKCRFDKQKFKVITSAQKKVQSEFP